jgi:hypothetical protein
MDVLKQVEEALVEIADDGIENSRDRRTLLAQAALTALRGLEWKPIAEMEEIENDPVYVCIAGDPAWVSRFTVVSKKRAVKAGYTYFCRPILPTPPKREVE